MELIDTAAEAVEFYAAKLGTVTYEANNYKVDTVLPDGTTTTTTKRDSAAVRQPRSCAPEAPKRRRLKAGESGPEARQPQTSITVSLDAAPSAANTRKRRREDHESRAQLCFREYWLANRKSLRPGTNAPAQLRLAELRERVAARAAARTPDTGL